jgi:hypothetical protein
MEHPAKCIIKRKTKSFPEMESSLFYGVFSDERGLKRDHKSSKQGNLKRRNQK